MLLIVFEARAILRSKPLLTAVHISLAASVRVLQNIKTHAAIITIVLLGGNFRSSLLMEAAYPGSFIAKSRHSLIRG